MLQPARACMPLHAARTTCQEPQAPHPGPYHPACPQKRPHPALLRDAQRERGIGAVAEKPPRANGALCSTMNKRMARRCVSIEGRPEHRPC